MSAKYQRIKQADLLLPAPLRWLTRAFSAITMAVILLTLVALYGTLASVPIAFLAKGTLYALIGAVTLGLATVLAYRIVVPGDEPQTGLARRVGLGVTLLLFGLAAGALGIYQAHLWAQDAAFFRQYHATVIYRLPYFEMTELEFYSWWPLKLILGLFVLNLIWATIRRIEFKFVNIGVLTVHTGIITVAIGSIFYGYFKVEGDTILWRKDLGGEPVDVFYDQIRPAVYFTVGNKNLMLELPGLPRYNDYEPDEPQNGRHLPIRLHDQPEFREVLGPNVRATIRGFYSYGQLRPMWVDAATRGEIAMPNPALRVSLGDETTPSGGITPTLVAGVPARRVAEDETFAVEYLVAPGQRRIDDLTAEFDGRHGLIVEVPAANFRQVYAIQPGQTIQAGDTGYTLHVEAVGPYEMSFATRGYEGARDTRAVVRVEQGQRVLRRMAMHRYPERSQDFVLPPPGAPPEPGVGPMGRRTDPDPSIRLTYLDVSKAQFRIIGQESGQGDLLLIARLPSRPPITGTIHQDRFPLGSYDGQPVWIHIVERMSHARQVLEPVKTPRNMRLPKDEGTLLHALLPLDLEVDVPGQERPWTQRIWMAHMRYPLYPDDVHRPVDVMLPDGRPIRALFSRQRRMLPFSMAMEGFEMQPYPGTDIPRDYVAHLRIEPLGPQGLKDAFYGKSRLNNPLIYRASGGLLGRSFKLSQTGWDPGDRSDPNQQARDPQGRFLNQQRFTILGVGNNVGIRIIFLGSCMISAGIPWAFYVKPVLLRRQKRKRQEQLARQEPARAEKTLARLQVRVNE